MRHFNGKSLKEKSFLFILGALGIIITAGGAILVLAACLMDITEVLHYGLESMLTGFILMFISYGLPPVVYKRFDNLMKSKNNDEDK